jgi:hypothetical protein
MPFIYQEGSTSIFLPEKKHHDATQPGLLLVPTLVGWEEPSADRDWIFPERMVYSFQFCRGSLMVYSRDDTSLQIEQPYDKSFHSSGPICFCGDCTYVGFAGWVLGIP